MFSLHSVSVSESQLFGYSCHDEDGKPIMRGLLHAISCVVCISAMGLSWLKYGSRRHPSDFVMAFFSMQYFASAVYHRHRGEEDRRKRERESEAPPPPPCTRFARGVF